MVFKIKNNVLWEYTGFDSVIVIPDNLIEIASNVFRSRDEITEVIIPEGVARIWDYTFAECKRLKKVTVLGDTAFGRGVFYGCGNLEELNAAKGLKAFGEGAFAGCSKLRSPELSDKKFELYTLTDEHLLNKNRKGERIWHS